MFMTMCTATSTEQTAVELVTSAGVSEQFQMAVHPLSAQHAANGAQRSFNWAVYHVVVGEFI